MRHAGKRTSARERHYGAGLIGSLGREVVRRPEHDAHPPIAAPRNDSSRNNDPMTAQTPKGLHGDPTAASNRATYDRIAVRYAENQDRLVSGNERVFADLMRAFTASIPPRGTVADLGCGPARDATRFAEAGFNALGMDLSAGMLAMASSAMDGRLVQADLRALPIRASTLDGIWCCAALLHVPEDDTLTVLREFRRTLASGGVLALVTALGDGARFEPVPYASGEQRWFAYRTAGTLADQLESADFTIHTSTRAKGNRDWGLVLAEAS